MALLSMTVTRHQCVCVMYVFVESKRPAHYAQLCQAVHREKRTGNCWTSFWITVYI